MPEKPEKKYRGIDVELYQYYVGDRVWQINQDLCTVEGNEKLRIENVKYSTVKALWAKQEIPETDKLKAEEDLAKFILTTCLVNFDWEAARKDPKLSRATLWGMAEDLYSFLHVNGSKEEAQHLQTQSEVLQNIYATIQKQASTSESSSQAQEE